MKSFLTLFFLLVFISTALGQMTNRLDKLEVNDLTTKKLDVVSITSGSRPCPKMTLAQRDAIVSPLEGQCIFNSTDKKLNVFNSVEWVEVGAGGEGGIANWETGKIYNIDDVVIYNSNIYQCIEQHTSTTFDPAKFNELARDLTNATGTLKLSNGGSNNNLTASSGSVIYSDADSMEMSSVGTSGQFLKSNGSSAPTWEDVSIDSNSFSGVLATSKGGTNKNITPSAGAIPYLDADSFEVLGAGTSGQFLKSNGTSAPSWGDVSVNDAGFSGVLSLGKGGTNKSITASNGAIAYSDADSLELSSVGTSGQILQSNGASAPTFVNKSISAKAGTNSSVVAEELQVSNNQLTQVDTNKHLIESNNKNILTNPSFEHSTVLTGWTNASGTASENLVNEIHGLKALSISLSSQALNLTQDSTLYASEFNSSVQGIATAMIKTSISGVKLCARQAGVTSTSLCVSHTGSGKWELLKIPFILGSTSNGLAIISSSSVTGTVYVDDTFVGAVDVSATQSFDTTCDTIACTTTFSAALYQPSIVSAENVDWLGALVSSGTNSQTKTVSVNSGTFSIAPTCTCTPLNTPTAADVTCQFDPVNSTTNSLVFFTTGNGAAAASGISVNCQRQGTDYAAAITAQKNFQKSKVSSYSSTNADTDWQACQFSTLAWQGLGTVTNGFECKRQGSDLLMRGFAVLGAVSASQAQLPLPLWNGSQLTINKGGFVGVVTTQNTTANKPKTYTVFPSAIPQTFLQFGIAEYSLINNAGAPILGNTSFVNSDTLVISNTLRIPIQGWENSNVIIGQFNGLESCKDSYECTDTFSAYVSASGVVSNENLDWINGNATLGVTGYSSFTFRSGINTAGMNCTATPVQNGFPTTAQILSNSVAGLTIYTFRTDTSHVAVYSDYIVKCQKGGADYIGKTAKAVFQTGALYSNQTVLSQGSNGANTFDVGTYTPTNIGTNTNVNSLNLSYDGQFKYMRVGNILFVSGRYTHNISVTNNFGYTISLPSFVTNPSINSSDCSGSAVGQNVGSGGVRTGVVIASASGMRVTSGYTDVGGLVEMTVHAMCILR